ncbi:MAG: hypothetical protein LIR46_08065 [Bacteroidota bacterium]|nr:hypothetical protein [Bacteroidota bacterium]
MTNKERDELRKIQENEFFELMGGSETELREALREINKIIEVAQEETDMTRQEVLMFLATMVGAGMKKM